MVLLGLKLMWFGVKVVVVEMKFSDFVVKDVFDGFFLIGSKEL